MNRHLILPLVIPFLFILVLAPLPLEPVEGRKSTSSASQGIAFVAVFLDAYYKTSVFDSATCASTSQYDGDRCINPKDFKFSISNGGKSTPFVGSRAGTVLQVSPGSYSINWEGGVGEFRYDGEVKFSLDSRPTFSSGCSGSIGAGDNVQCTVTLEICKGSYCG